MASESKEHNVLKLLLENSPLKEWHFNEITGQAHVTKAVASKWLKKYVREGLIRRIKDKGRFPYFTAGQDNEIYHSRKRLYALEQLYGSGLIPKLASSQASTIILFGSMAKGDWYKDSDIDIFVLGNLADFDRKAYERKLARHIELHIFGNRSDIRKVKSGLMRNVVNGYLIKGQFQDVAAFA